MRSSYYFVINTIVLGVPYFAFAQGPTDTCLPGEICNPIAAGSLSGLLIAILGIARDIGFIVGIFFIIYAGFLFVTAQGNEEKLKKAKNAFLWSVIGMAILLGAQIFANAIQETISNL